jgi:hypothetical protein
MFRIPSNVLTQHQQQQQKEGLCHTMALPFTLKKVS